MNRKEDIEALLADYLEGRLDPRRAKEVEEYIASMTDLHDDPFGSEAVLRPDGAHSVDFSALKLPVGPEDAETREKLYNLAVDGELDEGESKCFEALMHREEFRKEFEAVKKSVLRAPVVHMDKSSLYRHSVSHSGMSPSHTHSVLSSDTPRPSAEAIRTATWEDVPRLKPPSGVFYPDKRELHRKEAKVFGLWYRVGAAAAVILLLWMVPFKWEDDRSPRLTLGPIETKPPHVERPQELPAELQAVPIHPVEVLTSTETPHTQGNLAVETKTEGPEEILIASDEIIPEDTELPDRVEVAEERMEVENVQPVVDPVLKELTAESNSEPVAEEVSTYAQEYISIPQWVADKTREILAVESVPDPATITENAKRKAAELLDAEVSKNTVSTREGQRQTFAVRIGGIGFERSTSR